MPPGHLITGGGREEVLRKEGREEARSVRCMCDVCAAHGHRAAVGVDVDARPSRLSLFVLLVTISFCLISFNFDFFVDFVSARSQKHVLKKARLMCGA